MRTFYKYLFLLFSAYWLLNPIILAAENTTYRERSYVQTDKQVYLAGELVWMKYYLTSEKGIPVSMSKVGYIEILNAESTSLVQLKVELNQGIGEGCIELPADIPTGFYRIVAYTRYMRNEETDVFFEKTIGIINTFKVNETIEVDTTYHFTSPSPSAGNISVSSNLSAYTLRSTGEITLQGLPENVHSLGISVAGSESLPELSSSPQIASWHRGLPSLPSKAFEMEQLPEYEGHIVTGEIKSVQEGNALGYLLGLKPFLAFTGDKMRIYGGQIAPDGQVTFFTKGIKGTREVVTTVYHPDHNERYRIDIQSPFATTHPPKAMPSFKLNPSWQEQLQQRNTGMQILHIYMADSLNTFEPVLPYYRWKPDRSYILDEYTRFVRMEEVFIEFVLSARFRRINNKIFLSVINEERTAYSLGNSLIVLDGIPITDHEVIYNYDPLLVKRIDIYRGQYTIGQNIFNGIVQFTTYDNNFPAWQANGSTQLFDYEGTQADRRFYTPDYRTDAEHHRHIPDYRHTLLWQPQVDTHGEKTVTVPFSTSDMPGEYLITVEGLTTDGKPIYGTARFTVGK